MRLLVAGLLIAVVGLGIGVGAAVVLGGSDEPLAASDDTGLGPLAEDESDTPSTGAPQPESPQAGPSLEEKPADAQEPSPAETAEEEPGADPDLPSVAELRSALESYIEDLDSGDIDAAYAHVSPELRQQSGWSYEPFAAFRRDVITGCRVVSIDAVQPATGLVEATVDFALPGGEVSREAIRTWFVRGVDGALLLDGYEVLRTERIRQQE